MTRNKSRYSNSRCYASRVILITTYCLISLWESAVEEEFHLLRAIGECVNRHESCEMSDRCGYIDGKAWEKVFEFLQMRPEGKSLIATL